MHIYNIVFLVLIFHSKKMIFTFVLFQMGGMGGDAGFPHHHMNGGPRKYQCKMCPQVGLAKYLGIKTW